MFENTFKKDAARVPTAPPDSTPAEPQAWREKIAAAEGDDRALLQLAHQVPGVDLKLVALAALTQEDALKQAMREFRDQDKRLYRATKSRWQAAVAKREALTEAPVLIAAARTLIGRFNKLIEPTAESLWLALRVERKLGDKSAEAGHATQLRRRFSGSKEYQDLLKGEFE